MTINKLLRGFSRCFRHCYNHYNRLLFRLNGVKMGKGCFIPCKVSLILLEGGQLSIGHFFTLTGGTVNPLSRNQHSSIFVHRKAIIRIGEHVGISSSCLWANTSITIGNNVKIGANCTIMDNDAHGMNYEDRRFPENRSAIQSAPITIEDDVLIGTNSIILKGVRIGARSVIGAGSVVTKDIPCDCIAAGNPCKVLRSLTTNPTSVS